MQSGTTFKANSKPRIPLTKENILSRISEEAIFQKYLERDPSKKGLVTNPLRDDENPTCSFYTSKTNNRLMFHDFAMSRSWDCFAVVMQRFGLSFPESLERVNKDFKLRLNTCDAVECIEVPNMMEISRDKPLIQVIKKEWEKHEIEYWKSQGITKKELAFGNVISVEYVYVNKILYWRTTKKNPIFAYIYPSGNVKCYRPMARSQRDKWLGSADGNDINLYDQLPYFGDQLIITSSMKDALLLIKFGYTAIAPQGEGYSLDDPKYEALKQMFSEIIIFFDADQRGFELAPQRAEEMECSWVYIPEEYESKDITDFYTQHGGLKTYHLLNKIFKSNFKSTTHESKTS